MKICNLQVWKHVWRDDGKIAGELSQVPEEDKMAMLPQWGFGSYYKVKPGEVCDM